MEEGALKTGLKEWARFCQLETSQGEVCQAEGQLDRHRGNEVCSGESLQREDGEQEKRLERKVRACTRGSPMAWL